MKIRFSAVVEESLQRLDRGENLPDVLADYPAQAGQLESLLLVAMASRAFPVPVPGQTAQRLGRNQMLAEMAELEGKGALRKKPAAPFASRWVSRLAGALRRMGYNKLAYSSRLAMVSLVLILSGSFLTLNASASSQPGDLFYNLKVNLERSGLVWVSSSEDQLDDSSLPGQSDSRSARSLEVLSGVNSILTDNDLSSSPPAFSESKLQEEYDAQFKADEKEIAAAEREAEKDLRESEKAAAAEERETDKDLREAEKAAAADERAADKDLKEAEKEASQQLRDAEKQNQQPAADQNSKNPKSKKSAVNNNKKAK
ncbi:MAG: hypothetical protein P8Y37_09675 [Anaerolineales bacterium]